MSSPSLVIEFRNVRKSYVRGRSEVAALVDLTFEVGAGEFVTVLGPSGSGKSTLLHLAAALDLPTAGEVLIDGRPTTHLSDEARTVLRRERIGLVFQFFHLLPTLTVLENAALPDLLGGQRLSAVRERVVALLRRVGLGNRLDHLPEELSGGELQRVAIVRALVRDPPLLLADEPTGNLDTATGAAILDLLRELRDGRTLVVASHDERIAAASDRSLRLEDGHLRG